jgi:tetratricopeptide (TPR) repeat protein
MRTPGALLMLALLGGGLPAAHAGQAQPGLAPAATLEHIAALIQQQDPAGAKAAADRALALHPSDPALHNLAGVAEAQRGAYASAESHFLSAIRLAPRAGAAYTNLGRLYQERAAIEPAARAKALDVYRRLIASDPSNAEGLYQAAFLCALNGDFAESRTLIARLPDRARRAPQVLALLATDLEGLGDRPGAEAAATALVSHERLAADDMVALLPAFEHLKDDTLPQRLLEGFDARKLATPEMLRRLAAIHARHGRFVEARQALERAAAGKPTVPLLIDLARTAIKVGDRKGALGYLAHARSLDPRNATVHFLFGMVCVELNLGREAHDSLTQAVELDPDNPLINYAMGAVATHRHDPSEAVPYFEKYVHLKPEDPRGRFALGAARFYSGQLDEARRDLELAARASETATGAHYFLARIARQTNDLEAAGREIDLALRANPKYADAWAELGLIQTRSGDYSAAEASLSKALGLEPENYDATLHLAALYGRTKDPRRAAQEARLADLMARREARTQEFLRIIEVVP